MNEKIGMMDRVNEEKSEKNSDTEFDVLLYHCLCLLYPVRVCVLVCASRREQSSTPCIQGGEQELHAEALQTRSHLQI